LPDWTHFEQDARVVFVPRLEQAALDFLLDVERHTADAFVEASQRFVEVF
jgi:hypothetical protein